MQNAGLEETQAGIKIAGRNISNLRFADAKYTYLVFTCLCASRGTKKPPDESKGGE